MKTGAFIIPTGVGASIGGFAGDASKYARRLSKKCKLIVNPNVVNAACFSGITDNMLYVEGYTLDSFFKGKISLKESCNNRIGIVFDKAIPENILNIHINTINAVKTVYDIDIYGYKITQENVGVNFYIDKSGVSTGSVENLETIKSAAEDLIKNGCNAIAIVCLFPEDDDINYSKGVGVDPVGGVEAIISHYISKELKVPCAHAPAFLNVETSSEVVDSRCSAEYITPTFLPCILIGLSNAPLISSFGEGFCIEDLDFLVTPYNTLGGIPVLKMNEFGKKIYAIKENSTVLDITNENLSIKCDIINMYDNLAELI
ncbi:MAG: DUF3326 domain-containing protein [bacterium]|nr:DUF3326 domain-containing protein [bacterium]